MITLNWLTVAQSLPLNGQKKILHCGSTPSYSIRHTLNGWQAYCHRCSHKEWEPRRTLLSLAEIASQNVDQSLPPKWPKDSVNTLEATSPPCLLWMTWLARAGITQTLRSVYSLHYSPKVGKGLIPVFSSTDERTLSLTQQNKQTTQSSLLESLLYRKLDPTVPGPKYVLQTTSPETSVFLSISSRAGSGGVNHLNRLFDVVIVEDALSAMRVGEFVPAGSVLGTSRGQGKIERILKHSGTSAPRVGLWLDPDKAGRTGAAKIARSLSIMGVHTAIIESPRDPKNLSDTEIVRRLTGDRCNFVADYEAPS